MLSKSAAAREYGHIKKVINDRNRRERKAVEEANKRRKQEERERKAREAAEARQREEEEAERLRRERATRESLPRAASEAARERSASRAESPPRHGQRLPYADVRMEGIDVGSLVREEIPPPADEEPLPPDAVVPRPRMNRQGPTPMQELMNTLVIPGDNEDAGVFLNAIIQNQVNLSQQNNLIMANIQARNRVSLKY